MSKDKVLIPVYVSEEMKEFIDRTPPDFVTIDYKEMFRIIREIKKFE